MVVHRWLELEGVANCRDVGGLPLAAGGTTRGGVLLRSDALHDLTEADVALLVERLGVCHVVDLRAAGERSERGRGRLAEAGVHYSELEVFTDAVLAERRAAHGNALNPSGSMADAYRFFLEVGSAAFVTALERLVGPHGAPAVVHCAAGKDRTGVLVALLLDAAGVRPDAIVADYAATASRIDRVRERLASMSGYARFAAEATAAAMASDAATMEELLAWLHAEHGGAAGWFLDAGAPAEHLEAWARRLAE
ncbi:MAG: tyrosine-protein phosphatase [Acidimicrobiales bacterium]|nr:tyrosine-protein phosphatase [Acidimicrobiales bacterium]